MPDGNDHSLREYLIQSDSTLWISWKVLKRLCISSSIWIPVCLMLRENQCKQHNAKRNQCILGVQRLCIMSHEGTFQMNHYKLCLSRSTQLHHAQLRRADVRRKQHWPGFGATVISIMQLQCANASYLLLLLLFESLNTHTHCHMTRHPKVLVVFLL